MKRIIYLLATVLLTITFSCESMPDHLVEKRNELNAEKRELREQEDKAYTVYDYEQLVEGYKKHREHAKSYIHHKKIEGYDVSKNNQIVDEVDATIQYYEDKIKKENLKKYNDPSNNYGYDCEKHKTFFNEKGECPYCNFAKAVDKSGFRERVSHL